MGSYGTFDIDAAGQWRYSLDRSTVQHLSAGDSVRDSFAVTSMDGSASKVVVVTITGADDVISQLIVADPAIDTAFRYRIDGTPVSMVALATENGSARGAAAAADGSKYWVVDSD